MPVNEKTLPDVSELTICESTAEMLAKARRDDVELSMDRAASERPRSQHSGAARAFLCDRRLS